MNINWQSLWQHPLFIGIVGSIVGGIIVWLIKKRFDRPRYYPVLLLINLKPNIFLNLGKELPLNESRNLKTEAKNSSTVDIEEGEEKVKNKE